MVDDKVEMNNDSETYSTASTNDPKNVQELTQYVRKGAPNLKTVLVKLYF